MERKDFQRLAELTAIYVSPSEEALLIKEVSDVIEYIQQIDQLNLEGLEPTFSVNDFDLRLREDREEESVPRSELLSNTSQSQYGYIKVLKIVE